ncbi:MAG TPA: carbohydrate kinase family protein [Tissierellaceae bacterium]|nr:carbohydrate kinase family protein [Tissierellaceae bacterium]
MTYVVIVGGANIDIQGFPKEDLIYKDSNIGNVGISLGGVGRNIGENLVKLGIDTKLISVVGKDINGERILKSGRDTGINMEDTLVLRDKDTSVYLSILDKQGDMELAISSMDIYDYMDIDFIQTKRSLIEGANLCIIDSNIPKDVIEYMVKNFRNIDFFLDTVSTAKTRKIKDLIGYFHTIKPNKLEAEILTGIEINNLEDLKNAARLLHEEGVQKIFITLGEYGVFYSNGIVMEHIKSPYVEITNATGGGDAFVAALAYGYVNDIEIEDLAKLAMYASIVAISHEDTINPNMSIDEIKFKIKENEQC